MCFRNVLTADIALHFVHHLRVTFYKIFDCYVILGYREIFIKPMKRYSATSLSHLLSFWKNRRRCSSSQALMTATNCTRNGSVWSLTNRPNSISVWNKCLLDRGQMFVLPDAIRPLTQARTMFRFVNSKYVAKQKHQYHVRTDVLR